MLDAANCGIDRCIAGMVEILSANAHNGLKMTV